MLSAQKLWNVSNRRPLLAGERTVRVWAFVVMADSKEWAIALAKKDASSTAGTWEAKEITGNPVYMMGTHTASPTPEELETRGIWKRDDNDQ